jgi:hypothetical protein
MVLTDFCNQLENYVHLLNRSMTTSTGLAVRVALDGARELRLTKQHASPSGETRPRSILEAHDR